MSKVVTAARGGWTLDNGLWRAKAWLFPIRLVGWGVELVREIEETIAHRNLLRDGQAVLVAVSGGLDSMVLLHVLHALSHEHGWRLVVGHFNHRLRGRESDGDESLVRAEAKRLGLEFVREGWERKAQLSAFNVERSTLNVEPRAAKVSEGMSRQARHDFLGRTAQGLKIPSVALAHHADDQAELFFLRLFRGAGGEGLAGMKWINAAMGRPHIQLIRPFLAQRKEALRRYARENRIGFREDSSNVQLHFLRNRVRHELLPLLVRRFSPSVVATIVRAMDILGTDADFVRQAAEQWASLPKSKVRGPKSKARGPMSKVQSPKSKVHRDVGLWTRDFGLDRRSPFERLHPAVQRQGLRVQLAALGVTPEFDLVEELRLHPNKAISVKVQSPKSKVTLDVILRDREGRLIGRNQAALRFNRNRIMVHLRSGQGQNTFEGMTLDWQITTVAGDKLKWGISAKEGIHAPGCECFDAGKVGLRITLRHWRQGDRFQPIGMDRAVKLQDLFTNLKIPATRRRELVVAESCRGQIFWVEGLRLSEQFKLDAKTRRCLHWRWQRNQPA